MEAYVHFLSGGPCDGDRVPNYRPWEELVLTKFCEAHEKSYNHESDKCPDCKKHKYIKVESDEWQEADCPGLEIITPDGVDQAPILHRVNMSYEGQV